MIKDSLDNYALYTAAHPRFAAALAWLKANAADDIPDGRIEVDGDRIVALPQHYATHDFKPNKFEIHKKYIDIQYIVSGFENIWLGNPATMGVDVAFDEAKDISFLNGTVEPVKICAGEFMIIYPHEAHEPCVDTDTHKGIAVHKIIMKVAVE